MLSQWGLNITEERKKIPTGNIQPTAFSDLKMLIQTWLVFRWEIISSACKIN